MSGSPSFTTQLLGQTEKALNGILGRLLAGSGVTEPQWVALAITAGSGESVEIGELTARVAGVLKVDLDNARERITELGEHGLVDLDSGTVTITAGGRDFRASIGVLVTGVTERLWGDLPQEELDAAGRVLTAVLERVEGELAAL